LDWTGCGFVDFDFEACLDCKGASAFCNALLALFAADACWPAARAQGSPKGPSGALLARERLPIGLHTTYRSVVSMSSVVLALHRSREKLITA